MAADVLSAGLVLGLIISLGYGLGFFADALTGRDEAGWFHCTMAVCAALWCAIGLQLVTWWLR
jgi:hypothetical protein